MLSTNNAIDGSHTAAKTVSTALEIMSAARARPTRRLSRSSVEVWLSFFAPNAEHDEYNLSMNRSSLALVRMLIMLRNSCSMRCSICCSKSLMKIKWTSKGNVIQNCECVKACRIDWITKDQEITSSLERWRKRRFRVSICLR